MVENLKFKKNPIKRFISFLLTEGGACYDIYIYIYFKKHLLTILKMPLMQKNENFVKPKKGGRQRSSGPIWYCLCFFFNKQMRKNELE